MPLTAQERAKSLEPPATYGAKCVFVRDKEDVPHEEALPDLYALGRKRFDSFLLRGSKFVLPARTFVTGSPDDWDCALIVQPDTSAADMRKAFALLRLAGLEPLGEDEDEPELLDDGSVRLWLVPVDPENPFEE